MKLFKIFAFIFLFVFMVPSFALLPPSYLSVKKWKSCVATYKKGTAEFICIPERKPLECPQRSWEQLTEMSNIPSCPPKDEDKNDRTPIGGTHPLGTGLSH